MWVRWDYWGVGVGAEKGGAPCGRISLIAEGLAPREVFTASNRAALCRSASIAGAFLDAVLFEQSPAFVGKRFTAMMLQLGAYIIADVVYLII